MTDNAASPRTVATRRLDTPFHLTGSTRSSNSLCVECELCHRVDHWLPNVVALSIICEGRSQVPTIDTSLPP